MATEKENKKNLLWHTEKRKIGELKGYENNPRKLSEKNKEELEKSLKEFNVVDIPVLNIDNTIISGNQRIKILQELYGNDFETDVRIPNRKLTQQEIEDYNLYANMHMGEWDEKKLEIIPLHRLKKFGFNGKIEKIIKAIKENPDKVVKKKNLKPYKRIHILFSFHPDKLIEIKELIEKIKKIKGIEFEQGEN